MHHSIQNFNPKISFFIKWFASIMQIFGYAATGFDLQPWNIYFFLIGLIGWLSIGVLWNDKAIILIHFVALSAMIVGMAN